MKRGMQPDGLLGIKGRGEGLRGIKKVNLQFATRGNERLEGRAW